jgi:hypothetical protein
MLQQDFRKFLNIEKMKTLLTLTIALWGMLTTARTQPNLLADNYERGSKRVAPNLVITGFSATDGTFDNEVRLTWYPLGVGYEYLVLRSESKDKAGVPIGEGWQVATHLSDRSVDVRKTYFYSVKWRNRGNRVGISRKDMGYPKRPKVVDSGNSRHWHKLPKIMQSPYDKRRYQLQHSSIPSYGTFSHGDKIKIVVNPFAIADSLQRVNKTIANDLTLAFVDAMANAGCFTVSYSIATKAEERASNAATNSNIIEVTNDSNETASYIIKGEIISYWEKANTPFSELSNNQFVRVQVNLEVTDAKNGSVVFNTNVEGSNTVNEAKGYTFKPKMKGIEWARTEAINVVVAKSIAILKERLIEKAIPPNTVTKSENELIILVVNADENKFSSLLSALKKDSKIKSVATQFNNGQGIINLSYGGSIKEIEILLSGIKTDSDTVIEQKTSGKQITITFNKK